MASSSRRRRTGTAARRIVHVALATRRTPDPNIADDDGWRFQVRFEGGDPSKTTDLVTWDEIPDELQDEASACMEEVLDRVAAQETGAETQPEVKRTAVSDTACDATALLGGRLERIASGSSRVQSLVVDTQARTRPAASPSGTRVARSSRRRSPSRGQAPAPRAPSDSPPTPRRAHRRVDADRGKRKKKKKRKKKSKKHSKRSSRHSSRHRRRRRRSPSSSSSDSSSSEDSSSDSSPRRSRRHRRRSRSGSSSSGSDTDDLQQVDVNSKAWRRRTKRYLTIFRNNRTGTASQYVQDFQWKNKGRKKQALFAAQVLDDNLSVTRWYQKSNQMLVRRIAALELLDEINQNDWELVRDIVYPLTSRSVGVSELRKANQIAKARERLDARFKSKGNSNASNKGARGANSGRGTAGKNGSNSSNSNNKGNNNAGGGGRQAS